jgi:hypothetical protein
MKSRRSGWLAALRSPLSYAVLATLVMLGLLLAFHQVVLGAVQQGELRRKAAATQADAAWRCNAIPGARSREGCLMQLNATPPVRDAANEANLASLRRLQALPTN